MPTRAEQKARAKDPQLRAHILELYNSGLSLEEVGSLVGLSLPTVARIVRLVGTTRGVGRRALSPEDMKQRLLGELLQTATCWFWTGWKIPAGYGYVGWRGRNAVR